MSSQQTRRESKSYGKRKSSSEEIDSTISVLLWWSCEDDQNLFFLNPKPHHDPEDGLATSTKEQEKAATCHNSHFLSELKRWVFLWCHMTSLCFCLAASGKDSMLHLEEERHFIQDMIFMPSTQACQASSERSRGTLSTHSLEHSCQYLQLFNDYQHTVESLAAIKHHAFTPSGCLNNLYFLLLMHIFYIYNVYRTYRTVSMLSRRILLLMDKALQVLKNFSEPYKLRKKHRLEQPVHQRSAKSQQEQN